LEEENEMRQELVELQFAIAYYQSLERLSPEEWDLPLALLLRSCHLEVTG